MKSLRKRLKKLEKIERMKYNPLIHRIHKKHNISSRTLHYIKSYGSHSHIYRTIVKESLWILIVASIISSFGGLFLENIKNIFVSIVPLVILMPTLNDMIGDYGMIMSSHFTTLLYKGRISRKINKNEEMGALFLKIMFIALLTSFMSFLISLVISRFSGYGVVWATSVKLLFIIMSDVIILLLILFLVTFFAGLYLYKRNLDPDNFLIPITTSIADFGNMIVLTLLIVAFF